ncbi:MAG: hypothetical protein AAFX93_20360 [Verrucomicrobiota bacterium]
MKSDIRKRLQAELNLSKGSFLAAVRFDLVWDSEKFIELCQAMHSVSKENKGENCLDKDISQLFWYCGTFIPMWLEQRDFKVGQPDIDYHRAIEVLKKLGNEWFGDECAFEEKQFEEELKGIQQVVPRNG